MNSSNIENAPKLNPVKGVTITILGSHENLTLCHILIMPDAKIEDHSHHNEQSGFCVDGVGELTSGGETIKTIPGTAWTIPANETHSYINNGDKPVTIIEAFSPPRKDYLEIAK